MVVPVPLPLSLSSLESSLLSLIAQYLPIVQKLILRRLSRTIPPLSPAAFAHSHVDLPANALGWVRQCGSGASPLAPLLAHASSVSLRVKEWAWWPAHPTPSDEPSPLVLFPRLHDLYLAVDSATPSVDNVQTLLAALARSSPQLRSLSLSCNGIKLIGPDALQPLASLSRLAAVTLKSMSLHPSAFFFLCSLPLHWLSLSGAQNMRFDVGGVEPASWLTEVPRVSRTLHTLLLPQDEGTGTGVYEELFRLYRGEELHYLLPKGRPTAHLLGSIAAIASLTALDLSGFYNQPDLASDVSPLYTPDLAPRLPRLRHLVSIDWAKLNMSGAEHRLAFLLGCQQLVVAYGPQLHSLRLEVPCAEGEHRGQWVRHVVCHCTQLRLLHLHFRVGPSGHELHRIGLTPTLPWPAADAASSELAVAVASLQLHSLWLDGCTWADVQRCVFSSPCRVLEDCRLRLVANATLDSMAVIGRLSPRLRRLALESADDCKARLPASCSSSASSSSAAAAAAGHSAVSVSSSAATEPVFPELRILSVSHMAALLTPSRTADEAVAVLVGWLRRAPHFRLLCAGSGLTVRQAVTLSSLPQLRGLATSWCSHLYQGGDIGRFFQPRKGWSTVRLFQQHSRRWDAAESDDDMEDGANTPRFVKAVDGRSGREAFFEWLSSLPPQWEAEERVRRGRRRDLVCALRD